MDIFRAVGWPKVREIMLMGNSEALNAATDAYLAIFPVYIFWNLNIELRIKLGLMVLLGLGVL